MSSSTSRRPSMRKDQSVSDITSPESIYELDTTPLPNFKPIKPPRKKIKMNPTHKQLTAMRLINQGMSAHKAMLTAGYSKNVASNPGNKLFKSNAILTMIDRMKLELERVDVTAPYLATKFKQWLEAENKSGPDYQTQLGAYDRLKDIYDLKPQQNHELKRKITLEEFVNGEVQSEAIQEDTA